MLLLSMLIRSIVSYTVFIASRKIVKGGLDFVDDLKFNLKLHRCNHCWRLYSGQIEKCELCSSIVTPLYKIYEDNYYESLPEREGVERQIFNDTKNFKFEPIRPTKMDTQYDRYRTGSGRESSRSYQRRN